MTTAQCNLYDHLATDSLNYPAWRLATYRLSHYRAGVIIKVFEGSPDANRERLAGVAAAYEKKESYFSYFVRLAG